MVLESSREVAARREDPLAEAQPRVRLRGGAARAPAACAPLAPRAPRAPAPALPAAAQRRHLQVSTSTRQFLSCTTISLPQIQEW